MKEHDYPHEFYGVWPGDPKGVAYDPSHCAAECRSGPFGMVPIQCSRPNGHGHRGLFCRQHARKYPARPNEDDDFGTDLYGHTLKEES